MRGEQRSSMSALRAVSFLAAAMTFLLSALMWSLPGERSLVPAYSHYGIGQMRVKKSVGYGHDCNVRSPSREEIRTLKLLYREDNTETVRLYDEIYRQRDMVCEVTLDCVGNDVLSVKCDTGNCDKFVLKDEHSELPLNDVSPSDLEAIIRLRALSSRNMKSKCYSGSPSDFLDKGWQPIYIWRRTDVNCKEDAQKMTEVKQIHVIAVRFLSRWELLTRMESLKHLMDSGFFSGKVADFTRYQSIAWRDIDNLALLLQGDRFDNDESNGTLLDVARDSGFDVRIFDLSEEDYQRSLHIRSVLKSDTDVCTEDIGDNVFNQVPYCNCSIFRSGEIRPEEKLGYLANCLTSVNTADKNLLTITFLENSNWDVSLERTVDKALANIVENILSTNTDSTVFLFSDVGSSSLSHLDNSVFLQTQASNPFLFLLQSSGSIADSRHSALAGNRDKFISLRDIHETIVECISSRVNTDPRGKYENDSDRYVGLSILRSVIPSRPSSKLDIKSPNLCICEAGSALYQNDTLQVAYAEAAVGLINNYIQEKSNTENGRWGSHKCSLVIGKRFTNVRKLYKADSSYTIMDLEVLITQMNILKIIPNIVVKIEPSSETPHKLSIESEFGSIESIIDKRILPISCTERMNVNLSAIPSAKLPLVFSLTGSFGSRSKLKSIHGDCLQLLSRVFKNSISFYVVNVCEDRQYTVTFGAKLVNVFSLAPLPVEIVVRSGEARFITSFMKTSYFVKHSSFKYIIYHSMTIT